MLKDIGVDWTDRNFIAKLNLSQRAVIRIDGELSGYCIIGQGVIDKDVLCLHYCLTFISSVINEALEDIQEGANVGGVLIPSIRFADDQAMASHTVRGLQVIMDALQDTSHQYFHVIRILATDGRTNRRTVSMRKGISRYRERRLNNSS